MDRPQYIVVRCACGASHLVPNTPTWRFARWMRERPDVLWVVPTFLVFWFMVGSGWVHHANR